MWKPAELDERQRDACMTLLGHLHGKLLNLDVQALGNGPEAIACAFIKGAACEIVADEIRTTAKACPDNTL